MSPARPQSAFPSPSLLPTSEETWSRLDRTQPPWHAIDGQSLSRALGVGVNWTWNAVLRGTGPEPEPVGAYRGTSNRRLFLPIVVLPWLERKVGEPAPRPSSAWAVRWLAECGHVNRELSPEELWAWVELLESRHIIKRKWRVASVRAYLARLDMLLRGPKVGQIVGDTIHTSTSDNTLPA